MVEDRWETNFSCLLTHYWLHRWNSHLAGPLQLALTCIPPCYTPPQSAPKALSNRLYPLQNPVASLHGYKGSPPLQPLSHTSADTTQASLCYFALPSVLLWHDYRFTRSRFFTAVISNPLTAAQSLPFLHARLMTALLICFISFCMCMLFCIT